MKTFFKNLLLFVVLIGFELSSIDINSIPEQPKPKDETFDESKVMLEFNSKKSEWFLVADNVEATVYNAVPEQCDNDPIYTASMFRLNLDDVYSHRIIAMESTFMKALGLKYGDVVKVEGTGIWDGVWQIQDTMNPRFAGRKKIDFLVPNDVRTGKWNTVKLYCLTNKENTDIYKKNMAPQSKKQIN